MTIAEKLYAEGYTEGFKAVLLAVQLLLDGEPLEKIAEKTNLELAWLKIFQANMCINKVT